MKRARNQNAKDNRRQAILDSAKKIIEAKGLTSLSIATVAKKTKLAVGTIYLYFPKKEDIIAQLTIESRHKLLQKFEESSQNKTNALDKIRELLFAYFSFYEQNQHYYDLVSLYESNAGLEKSKALVESSAKITNFVMEILKEGKAQGYIQKDLNEKEFAFLLWGSANGIIQLINVKSQHLLSELNIESKAFFKSFSEMVIRSIEIK